MIRPRLHRPSPAMVVALVALGVALSGTAYAANGGNFVLGQANTASKVSTLTNTAGTALKLNSPSGVAPLALTSTTMVKNLNANLLGGSKVADLTSTVVGQGSTSGPLPYVLSETFQMTGKVSLLTFEGSGYRSTTDGPGYLEINVFACPGVVVTCTSSTSNAISLGGAATFSNEVESHKELSVVLPFEVPAGAYTIGLQPETGTTTDGTDYYQVSVVSLG